MRDLEKKRAYCREYHKKHAKEINARHRANYLKNPEHHKEYSKEWRKQNPGKLKTYYKKYYQENIERERADGKKYGQTEQGKEVRRKNAKKYRLKNRQKFMARVLLQRAILANKINKPKFCSKCGKDEKIEGHHPDYSKPLEVVWLCYKCHLEEERLKRDNDINNNSGDIHSLH